MYLSCTMQPHDAPNACVPNACAGESSGVVSACVLLLVIQFTASLCIVYCVLHSTNLFVRVSAQHWRERGVCELRIMSYEEESTRTFGHARAAGDHAGAHVAPAPT